MQPRRTRSGFTLVELTVGAFVLGSIGVSLLGAVTSTRQDARIAGCTSNLSQHAQGMANFASANNQVLPNAPISPGGEQTDKLGPRGTTAFRFATTDRPINGFAFGEDGIRTMGHPSGPPTFLTHTDQWMNSDQSISHLYWAVLAEYMTDGRGVGAMQDVFLSPSDDQGRAEWDLFIEWVKGERNGDLPALPNREEISAPIAALEDRAGQGISNGSYLYPSSMVVTPEVWLRNPRTGAPVNADLYEKWGRFDAAGDTVPTIEEYHRVVRRNRMSDILYPPLKVAFFLDRAVHDADAEFWFQPGATSTIALSDGSARSIRAAEVAAASDPRENLGPVHKLVYKGPDHPGNSPFSADGEGATELPFVANWGGIRGRDLE